MIHSEEIKQFANRKDAGIQLGKHLEKEFKGSNALVLGIPRGGVEVAYYIAKTLKTELSTIISKKLPLPGQPEVAFGAIAEDGTTYTSDLAENMEENILDTIKAQQLFEIHRRIEVFRHGKPITSMTNRPVIIVDDGIATGATILPTIHLCKAHKAAKIIIAVPVCGRILPELVTEVNDIIVLIQAPDLKYISQFYKEFNEINDDKVLEFLQLAEGIKKGL